MAEYTPSGEDERIAHAYAEVIYHGSEGMVSREEGVAEFYAYLAAHDARVRRDAARSALDGLARDLAATSGDAEAEEVRDYRDTHYPETED